MTKGEAIQILGDGSLSEAARSLGVHPSQVTRLPEVLELGQADRVRGAAMRLRKKIPVHLRREKA